MKIVFIGTVEFSYEILKLLIKLEKNVVAVVTKSVSSFNTDFKDLTPLCEQANIPYKHVRDINHEKNVEFIQSFQPDVIYCFGWSQLIKKQILDIAPLGVVGYHPAELPYNRGRHPIIWALSLGLSRTASTFFFMDEGADTGDILSQEPIDIEETDNAKTLYEKVISTAISQIEIFTNQLENGSFLRVQQTAIGNTWRKRGRNDGEIDFRMPSNGIYNLVRALGSPYVGAHICFNEKDYKVWQCRIVDAGCINDEPGKILEIDGQAVTVKTADRAIILYEHDFPLEDIKIGDYL